MELFPPRALVYVFHILLVLREGFNVLVRISHLDILLFFTLANGPKQFNFTHNVKKMWCIIIENQPVIFIDKR